jgi:hypothetical protein
METQRGLMGPEFVDSRAVATDCVVQEHKIRAGLIIVPF